jgi:hypothetical protein
LGLTAVFLLTFLLLFIVFGCGKGEPDGPGYYKGKDFKTDKGKTGPKGD